jgi:hypothetical protein
MNKADLKRLEAVFSCDIDPSGNALFQSKSKHYDRLEQEGYVTKVSYVLGGRFPVKIAGWTLTFLGNFTYCMSCKDEEMDIEEMEI